MLHDGYTGTLEDLDLLDFAHTYFVTTVCRLGRLSPFHDLQLEIVTLGAILESDLSQW